MYRILVGTALLASLTSMAIAQDSNGRSLAPPAVFKVSGNTQPRHTAHATHDFTFTRNDQITLVA